MALVFDMPEAETATALQALMGDPPVAAEIARAKPLDHGRKYDAYLDPETLSRGIELDAVEIESSLQMLRSAFDGR